MELLRRSAPLARPVKVLQFGEGNFIRAFLDWLVERMNRVSGFDGAVQIVKPRGGIEACRRVNDQDGLYHIVQRGVLDGKPVESIELVECVRGCLDPVAEWESVLATARLPELRFVFSNTTEAGIEYRAGEDTFPSKVARLLAARCEAGLPGLVFLPCELIEANGDRLRECVLKYLSGEPSVAEYVERECVFCNTLVDRIVSGFPQKDCGRYFRQLGAEDRLLVCGEPFFFLAIQGPEWLSKELPFEKTGLDVRLVKDLAPYRTRKVRFLNGAHTSSVLGAHLAGLTYVDEMVRDERFGAFLRRVLFEEVMPTVCLPEDEKKSYAQAVLERFANPFAEHRLLSIALNSVSKWRVRVLPTLLDYTALFGKLPPCLTKSMSYLIDFYRTCPFQDTPQVTAFFERRPGTAEILGNTEFWGMDLNGIPGFTQAVAEGLEHS